MEGGKAALVFRTASRARGRGTAQEHARHKEEQLPGPFLLERGNLWPRQHSEWKEESTQHAGTRTSGDRLCSGHWVGKPCGQ